MRETGEHFGSITRADRERFDPKSVLLACSGPKKRGRKTTVPCNVLIEGTKNDGLGIPKVMTVEYNKTSQMQRFYLDDVSNVNTLSFSITQAGKDGKLKKDVTLVLDTFDYEFDDGGE